MQNDRNFNEHENDDGILKKKRKTDHTSIHALHGSFLSVYFISITTLSLTFANEYQI